MIFVFISINNSSSSSKGCGNVKNSGFCDCDAENKGSFAGEMPVDNGEFLTREGFKEVETRKSVGKRWRRVGETGGL